MCQREIWALLVAVAFLVGGKTLTGGNVWCLHKAVSALRYVCMSCFLLRLPVRLAPVFLSAIGMPQLYLAEITQSPVALPRLRGLTAFTSST